MDDKKIYKQKKINKRKKLFKQKRKQVLLNLLGIEFCERTISNKLPKYFFSSLLIFNLNNVYITNLPNKCALHINIYIYMYINTYTNLPNKYAF
jgi:hypothetical protein